MTNGMSNTDAKNLKITVVGLGNAGVRIVGALGGIQSSQRLNLLAVDTDSSSLSVCTLPEEQKILADQKWRNGRGCGGEVMKGQRSMATERARIEELIENSSLLVLTGGLGGGTGTGGAPAFAGVAKKLKIPSIFIMTMPFSLEGHSKRRIAEDGIRELLSVVDVMLCLPNDLLFSTLPAETPVTDAFKRADHEVARAVLGVAEILRNDNLLSSDFEDFNSVVGKKKSYCSIGVGCAAAGDGLNRCHLALERMLDSPLLGGAEKLQDADTVFLSLNGGDDMNIGETKKTFEAASKFINKDAKLVISANTDQSFGDLIQLTAVAIKYDRRDKKDVVSRSDSFGVESVLPVSKQDVPEPDLLSGAFEQGELPLQNISRGIFLNTTPVTYDGEDLDVPTFQRRMINIDKGV
jgi:cell division protein FtsZ